MTPRKQFRLLAVLAAVIGAFAAVAPVASAETPAPGYEQFAGCPSPKSENPAVNGCIRTEITGGKFKLGNKNVPISQPLTLSGGTVEGPSGELLLTANSKGGLSPVKLPVPGGVIGLTGLDWLINFLNINELKLYAEAQIAGVPKLITPEHVVLPLRMHLINPVLGNNCFVGSFTEPVVLDLTTGTSGKLTGKEPVYSFDNELSILHANNGTFVDGLFKAPGANGCQLTLFGFLPIDLDPIVNLASGLPAGSGTNETVQNYNLEVTEDELVYP